MVIQQALQKLSEHRDLSDDEAVACADEMATGAATPAQMSMFLAALRQKGETAEEIASFAKAFRAHSVRIYPSVPSRIVDTCGTGGDGSQSFNVSTVAAFVASGAGAFVAKHGNRSVTSRCGSADLLERLGFNLDVEPARVKDSIEKIGIGFMFAPAFHPAMKRVAQVRRELGGRTIFNILGPLINPAGARAQVVGVYGAELVPKISGVLKNLGTEEAMVCHSAEGMDEISVKGKTVVAHLKDGGIACYEISPEVMGLGEFLDEGLQITGPDDGAKIALEMLEGRATKGRRYAMVVANAGAALIVSGRAEGFRAAIAMARESIDTGSAFKKMEEMIRFSGGDLARIELHARN